MRVVFVVSDPRRNVVTVKSTRIVTNSSPLAHHTNNEAIVFKSRDLTPLSCALDGLADAGAAAGGHDKRQQEAGDEAEEVGDPVVGGLDDGSEEELHGQRIQVNAPSRP